MRRVTGRAGARLAVVGLPLAAMLIGGIFTVPALAQDEPRPQAEQRAVRRLLPAQPVKPARGGELKCGVVEWNSSAAKPVLTVVCPPEEVFAPLRVYLGFSWERAESIPVDPTSILAMPRSRVRVEFTPTQAHVLLKVSRPGGKKAKEKWVSFDEVVRIGFSTEP